MIVLGGGGGPLKSWQSEWGKFHHAMEVTARENGLSENVMVLRKGSLCHHSLQWRIVVDILPLIQNRVWITYAFFVVFLSAAILLLIVAKNSGRSMRILKR